MILLLKDELLELIHAFKQRVETCASPFQHLEMKGLIKMTFKISLALTFYDDPSIYLGLGRPDFLSDKSKQCKKTSKQKPVMLE